MFASFHQAKTLQAKSNTLKLFYIQKSKNLAKHINFYFYTNRIFFPCLGWAFVLLPTKATAPYLLGIIQPLACFACHKTAFFSFHSISGLYDICIPVAAGSGKARSSSHSFPNMASPATWRLETPVSATTVVISTRWWLPTEAVLRYCSSSTFPKLPAKYC